MQCCRWGRRARQSRGSQGPLCRTTTRAALRATATRTAIEDPPNSTVARGAQVAHATGDLKVCEVRGFGAPGANPAGLPCCDAGLVPNGDGCPAHVASGEVDKLQRAIKGWYRCNVVAAMQRDPRRWSRFRCVVASERAQRIVGDRRTDCGLTGRRAGSATPAAAHRACSQTSLSGFHPAAAQTGQRMSRAPSACARSCAMHSKWR